MLVVPLLRNLTQKAGSLVAAWTDHHTHTTHTTHTRNNLLLCEVIEIWWQFIVAVNIIYFNKYN